LRYLELRFAVYSTMRILIFLVALTANAADLPKYWSIHIDHPADRAAFARLEREFTQTIGDFYATNHLDAPAVITLVTADGRYYGLRPRNSLADFEKPSLDADLEKRLQAKTSPISEATHKTLRDHHNEIWQVERELTTTTEIAPHKYAMLRTDYVSPPNNANYEAKMKQLIHELASVDVVAFFSVYGDGSYRYLFLSDSPIKVRKLKGLADTHDAAARF
jgi:hypothetical protein